MTKSVLRVCLATVIIILCYTYATGTVEVSATLLIYHVRISVCVHKGSRSSRLTIRYIIL